MKEKWLVSKIIFWSLVVGVFNFSAIIIVGPFLKIFSQGTREETLNLVDLVPEKLVSTFGVSADFFIKMEDLIWILPAYIVAVGLLSAIAQYNLKFLQQLLSINATDKLRLRLFNNILRQPFSDIKKRTASEWMSLVLNDMYFYQRQFTQISTGFFKNFAIFLGAIPAMFFVSFKLFIVYILIIPILVVFFKFFGASLSRQGAVYQGMLRSVLNALFDIRKRLSFIKVESTEEQAYSYYVDKDRAFSQKIKKVIFARNFISPFVEFFGYAVFALTIYLFVHGSFEGFLAPVQAIQFVVAIGLSVKPIRETGTQYSKLQESLGVLSTASEYLLESQQQTSLQQNSSAAKQLSQFSIKKVQYRINDDLQINLEDLHFKKGDFIAVIGASGSGKSTFLRLMAGLLPPDIWNASCAWEDCSDKSILLTQQPFVFSDSVLNNVGYGSQEYDADRLKESTVLSRYNHMMKGRGVDEQQKIDFLRTELSGGQKQSLSLSRVFYQHKMLCLLDEPTSAYDLKNESVLYENIKDRLSDRITVMITHRLSHLDLFSEVWFFDKGQMVCKGKHQDLLTSSSAYKDFCTAYSNV